MDGALPVMGISSMLIVPSALTFGIFFTRALFAAPTVLMLSAIFFAVATMTRSMMYSYVAVVAFLVAYVSFNVVVVGDRQTRERYLAAKPDEYRTFTASADADLALRVDTCDRFIGCGELGPVRHVDDRSVVIMRVDEYL